MVELRDRAENRVAHKQPEAEAVPPIPSYVRDKVPENRHDAGRGQQKVGQLPVLKVAQKAHVPVVLLHVRVGHRYVVAAPRRHLLGRPVAGQHVALLLGVVADVVGELDVQVVAEQVEVVRVQQAKVEEHEEDDDGRLEDHVQQRGDGEAPQEALQREVGEEHDIDEAVGAAHDAQAERECLLHGDALQAVAEEGECQPAVEALRVGGREEDGARIDAEEEGGEFGARSTAEDEPAQVVQRLRGLAEEQNVQQDGGEEEQGPQREEGQDQQQGLAEDSHA